MRAGPTLIGSNFGLEYAVHCIVFDLAEVAE